MPKMRPASKIFNTWYLLTSLEDRIARISDQELEFRGWTREGMRRRYLIRMDNDKRSP